MFRVTALLLVAIAMQSAAIAQDAKQDMPGNAGHLV
jgi:hypothetical protein